jgi:hypothetical protein
MSGEEAIDDAPLLKIVGSHLNLDLVSGEDADTMDAHATCQVTEERVILCLLTGDSDLECGVGIRFFHNADQFNYILRHR